VSFDLEGEAHLTGIGPRPDLPPEVPPAPPPEIPPDAPGDVPVEEPPPPLPPDAPPEAPPEPPVREPPDMPRHAGTDRPLCNSLGFHPDILLELGRKRRASGS